LIKNQIKPDGETSIGMSQPLNVFVTVTFELTNLNA